MAERICPQCGLETAAALCPEHQCPTVARPTGNLSQLQVGTVVDQRYRIEGQLGKGGFGAVFLASHVATRQQVVLKVLKPDLTEDPTQVQRFYNEARASSLLSHPHTVRVHDFGQTDGGLLYIAMERLHGRELAQAIKDAPGGRIAPLRLARIAIAVCKSLSEAHHAGLVHRDLKPDNVFLCDVHGEDEFVKVIDFGIAKPVDAPVDGGLTRTGFTVGTPKYMSPEQVMQRPLDGRSDLYSLGIVMYQCLCGEVPFAGTTPMETLMAHLQMQALPLAQRVQGLPASLVAVVEKAMAKQPADRFADADAMRAALAEVLIELQDSSSPPTQTGRRHAVVVHDPKPVPVDVGQKPQGLSKEGQDAAAKAPRTATTQPAAHKLQPGRQPQANSSDSTDPHAEVFSVGPRGSALAASAPLPGPAPTPAPAPPPVPAETLALTPAASPAPTEAAEPEVTLYAQSPGDLLDMPTFIPEKKPAAQPQYSGPGALAAAARDAETALLEHPTLRDDYQPQTLSLPTAKLADPPGRPAELAAESAPAAAAGPTRGSAYGKLAGGALAAIAIGLGLWYALASRGSVPTPPPAAPAEAPGPNVLAAPKEPVQAAPAPPSAPPSAPSSAPPSVAPSVAPSATPSPAPAPVAPPAPAPQVAAVAAPGPATAAAAAAPLAPSPAEAAQPAKTAEAKPVSVEPAAARRDEPKAARKAAPRSRPTVNADGDKAL